MKLLILLPKLVGIPNKLGLPEVLLWEDMSSFSAEVLPSSPSKKIVLLKLNIFKHFFTSKK
jgi:hypothetical protein